MRPILPLLGLLALSACAQSSCGNPDVRAFVDRAVQSRDLYAVGLTYGAVRQTPLPLPPPASGYNPRRAICSAWLLSRNPAYAPGGTQPPWIQRPQTYWVARLAYGYEVGLIARP
ncbi:hypothetical protein [Lichenicoccus sp.]|uniref:hypothetical protein n=1 Tax=Lichenicoccus sp. TaxID=2781899 RepID=UPI003D0AEA53